MELTREQVEDIANMIDAGVNDGGLAYAQRLLAHDAALRAKVEAQRESFILVDRSLTATQKERDELKQRLALCEQERDRLFNREEAMRKAWNELVSKHIQAQERVRELVERQRPTGFDTRGMLPVPGEEQA